MNILMKLGLHCDHNRAHMYDQRGHDGSGTNTVKMHRIDSTGSGAGNEVLIAAAY